MVLNTDVISTRKVLNNILQYNFSCIKLHIIDLEKDTILFSLGSYYQPDEILFQRKQTLLSSGVPTKHFNNVSC